MQNRTGTALALIAAVIAVVVVATGGPLIAAVAVAIVGGLLGSLAPRLGKRNESVGIR